MISEVRAKLMAEILEDVRVGLLVYTPTLKPRRVRKKSAVDEWKKFKGNLTGNSNEMGSID